MEGSPIALELRRMQMLSEIGIDNNTTTVILMPSDFTNAAKSFTELVNKKNKEVVAFFLPCLCPRRQSPAK